MPSTCFGVMSKKRDFLNMLSHNWQIRDDFTFVNISRVIFMDSEKCPSSLYNHSFLPVLAATYLTHEVVVAIRGLQVRVI